MSPYSGNKFSEEEELDLFYLEIEERILLLISEEEEENEDKVKTERTPLLPLNRNTTQFPCNNYSFLDASYYNNSFIKQLQQIKKQRGGYHGSQNIEKTKNKPWIQYATVRNIGGKRVSEINERRGTGVFLPKSASFGSATFAYHN